MWVGVDGRRHTEFMLIFGVGWEDFFRECVCMRGRCRLERGWTFRWGMGLSGVCEVRERMLERMGGNLGMGMMISGGWRVCVFFGDCVIGSHDIVTGLGVVTGWRKDRREVAWAEISILNILSLDSCATLNSSSHARIRALGSFLRVGRDCSIRCLSFDNKLSFDSEVYAWVNACNKFFRSRVESVTLSKLCTYLLRFSHCGKWKIVHIFWIRTAAHVDGERREEVLA